MNTTSLTIRVRSALIALSVGMIVAGAHAVVIAAELDGEKSQAATSFTRRPYISLGAGISRLNPENDQVPPLRVRDSRSSGYHAALGYDLTRWLSAEVYFADIGESEIEFFGTSAGPVGYQVYGISAIAYLYNNRSGFGFSDSTEGLFRREGLSFYTRAGIGSMSNQEQTGLDIRRDHAAHLVMGVGLEYGFANGWALRAEATGYDTDARYLSASVVKRFGQVPIAAPIVALTAALPEIPAEPPVANDNQVIEFPTILFAFDRSSLSSSAIVELNKLVEVILDYDTQMEISGHTDWISTEEYNYDLSARRAQVVKNYLVSRGIDASRLSVQGLGESQPVRSNDSSEGRAQNRRVEFRLR